MKLNLFVLKTAQPEKLAEFYQQLGIKFDQHRHGTGPLHFVAEVNGITFEIYPLSKDVNIADNTLRLGFTVTSLDHLIENLKKQGTKVIKDATITEWGYQALIEDPDGRKIELKDGDVSIARYRIDDRFKITGRGLVVLGPILEGVIYTGDEITFSANGRTRKRRIKGIDSGMRKLPLTEPVKIGLLLECIDEYEVDELRQWNPEGQVALIRNTGSKNR